MSDTDLPQLRTVVLADSILAQPVFETLLRSGWIVGLGTTNRPNHSENLRHLAQQTNTPIFAAERENLTTDLADWLLTLCPDVLISFTFPYRLPLEVLTIPRLGAFNLHGGKLPEYRGPQPIFWQLRNGENEGAVTAHRMDSEFDHGAIVAVHTIPIAPEDTHGLHGVRLAFTAVKVVEALCGGLLQYGTNLPTMPQDESRAGFHPRPAPKDLRIKWQEQSGAQIRALVKACNPWNQGAVTMIRGINLHLTDVTLLTNRGLSSQPPGTILTADVNAGIVVNCCDGSALQIDVVSMDEGIMSGKALAQLGIQAGEQFDVLPQ